eukprot:3983750-Amphidinium_carterae.1
MSPQSAKQLCAGRTASLDVARSKRVKASWHEVHEHILRKEPGRLAKWTKKRSWVENVGARVLHT